MKTHLFVLLLVFSTPSVLKAQRTDIGQLESQYNTTPTSERAIALSKAYQDQATWFRHSPQFSFDSVFLYFKKAFDLLENTQVETRHALSLPYERLAEVHCDLGEFSNRTSEFAKAEAQANKAAFYFQQGNLQGENLKMLEFDILHLQAMCKVHNYPEEALKIIEPAWRMFQDDQTPEIQAKLWGSKGLLYDIYIEATVNEMQLSSASYLRKSTQLYESLRKPETHGNALFINYQALAWYYGGANEKIDSCDYYFDKMKQLLPILKDPIAANRYYSLRGNALSRRKDFTAAKAQISKSLALCDTYHLKHTSIYRFNQNLMGVIAMNQGQYDTAAAYFTTANGLAIRYNHNDKKVFFEHMAQLNEKKGDFEKALFYHKIYTDSASIERDNASLELLGKSELKLNVLSQEKELTKKQTQQNIFIGAILLGTLLTGLLYRNYRLKQKINLQLAHLNTALEDVNKDLATKNTLLDKRNAENELLLREIHHRVKNNLEVVSSLLQLQTAQIDDPSIQSAMLASQNRVQSMGIIHQKLYQGEHLASIEMQDYFVNLSESILDSFSAEGRIKIECNMPKLVLDVDTAISIGLITNELITNALKYAFTDKNKGEINISLTEDKNDPNSEGNLLLKISDDGIGKPVDGKAHGTGFGTQLINLLTTQLDGKLIYEINHGTIVSLAFKKPKARVTEL
jgi:two-component system, sensor histidine kinase PdtaS